MSTHKQKILVTGATGFLGFRCALRFHAEGYAVTGVGRNPKAGASLEKNSITFKSLDLTDAFAVDAILQGFDAVIHCGALSSPWGKYEEFYRANFVGTKNIVDSCIEHEVRRLVHVSTPSIYVDTQDRWMVKESDPLPLHGINDYANTKRMAEECVANGFSRGLETIVIRPQGIVGPGDTSILPRLIRVAERGKLPVIGNGDNWIDLTYVENVVEALFLAYRAPADALGQQYNITNGEPVKLYETLEKIFKQLGFKYEKKNIPLSRALKIASGLEWVHRWLSLKKEPLLTKYGVCVLGLSRTLDISLAKQKLNYRPKVSMEQAISEIVKSYRAEKASEANP